MTKSTKVKLQSGFQASSAFSQNKQKSNIVLKEIHYAQVNLKQLHSDLSQLPLPLNPTKISHLLKLLCAISGVLQLKV